MPNHQTLIHIEVAYALREDQVILPLNVPEGTTVGEAIEQSGITERFPGICIEEGHAGIFGKVVPLSRPLSTGDRVEIYRPLVADPKEVRRQRARKSTSGGSQSRRNRGASGIEDNS